MQTNLRPYPTWHSSLLIIFHSFAILSFFFGSSLTYSQQNRDFQAYVPTVCYINQTDVIDYPCNKNGAFESLNICQDIFFGIIYDDHRFLYTNRSLHGSGFSSKRGSINSTHFYCYYHQTKPHLVLKEIPQSDGFKYLLGLNLFGMYACIIHIIDQTVLSRRWWVTTSMTGEVQCNQCLLFSLLKIVQKLIKSSVHNHHLHIKIYNTHFETLNRDPVVGK